MQSFALKFICTYGGQIRLAKAIFYHYILSDASVISITPAVA
jgi:hypothetical protein